MTGSTLAFFDDSVCRDGVLSVAVFILLRSLTAVDNPTRKEAAPFFAA